MPFKKGQIANPKGRPKGSLNIETLTKLERRAYFDKLAAEHFERWVRECRPEYGLDQTMGSVKTIVEVRGEKRDLPERIKKGIEYLKETDK